MTENENTNTGGNAYLSASEAAIEVKVSIRVIQQALRSGALRGRNVGGRRGWVTTKAALQEWVELGNHAID